MQRLCLAGEVFVGYARARRALKDAPVTTVLAQLRAKSDAAAIERAQESRLQEARALGRAVTRTLGLLPGDTRCLMQSLVLTRLLSARGIAGSLVIGTRTSPSFLAHAWVEHCGEPVLATGDGLFDTLVEL
jgi:Transglutaminase-like superfamily